MVAWLRNHGKSVFISRDACAGYIVAALTAAGLWAWPDARDDVSRSVGPLIGFGVAAVGICLGSLALLSGLLDETMTLAIDATTEKGDGVAGIVTAFRVVATEGAILVAVAAVTMALSPAAPDPLRVALPAVAIGLAAWCLFGLGFLLLIAGDLVKAKAERYRLQQRADDELRRKRASGE